MIICFRDQIGLVTIEVNNDTDGISFDGQFAYFTDAEGRDYRISTRDIVMIGKKG